MYGEHSITVTYEPARAVCKRKGCGHSCPVAEATLCWRDQDCELDDATQDVKIWFEVENWGQRPSRDDPGSAAELRCTGVTDLRGRPINDDDDLRQWARQALQEQFYHRAVETAEEDGWWAEVDRGYQEAKDRSLGL